MGKISIWFGLAANLVVILAPLLLLSVPTGSQIPPAAQAAPLVFGAFLGILGCLAALSAMMDEDTHQTWRVGLLVGILPLPLGTTARYAASIGSWDPLIPVGLIVAVTLVLIGVITVFRWLLGA